MSPCQQYEDALWHIAEGGAPGEKVRAHLQQCDACRRSLEALRQTICGFVALREVAVPDPSTGVWARLLRQSTPWRLPLPATASLFAAAMLLLLALSSPLHMPWQRQETNTEIPSPSSVSSPIVPDDGGETIAHPVDVHDGMPVAPAVVRPVTAATHRTNIIPSTVSGKKARATVNTVHDATYRDPIPVKPAGAAGPAGPTGQPNTVLFIPGGIEIEHDPSSHTAPRYAVDIAAPVTQVPRVLARLPDSPPARSMTTSAIDPTYRNYLEIDTHAVSNSVPDASLHPDAMRNYRY